MLDLKGYGWMLWQGLAMTLAVGLCALMLAIVMGLLGAWGKLSRESETQLSGYSQNLRMRGNTRIVRQVCTTFYSGITTRTVGGLRIRTR